MVMQSISPFKVFNNWLFDGDIKTPFPEPTFDENGNIKSPDLLKYNCPITPTYILKYFQKNLKMNHYLNKYFNNENIYYLNKKEFFYFIKRFVIDFKFNQRQLLYIPFQRKDKLKNSLSLKCPYLKPYEIELLSEMILKDNSRNNILSSLGLEDIKKPKRKKKNQTKKNTKISMKEFIQENFSIYDI
jgi:hypothetical protein